MVYTEKITFNLPVELKAKVTELKDELQTSFSHIYVEATREFVKKQEDKKWARGFELASKDQEYQKL
ncbi:MAG: hypothetical protein WC144_07900 [Sulfurimonas sp.]|jgi:predicted transcriptional regulator|nr:hypothetical protein [Sulfurimonadaceae bacterium]